MTPPSRVVLWTATVSGLLAGLVMSGVMMAFGLVFREGDWLFGARVLGAVVTRQSDLAQVDVQAMVTGMFVHLTGPALFWSRIFGTVRGFDRHPASLGKAVLTGVGTGIVAHFLDVRLILPAIQRATDGRNIWAMFVPEPLDWASHLAFGLVLGGAYAKLIRAGRRTPGRPTLST